MLSSEPETIHCGGRRDGGEEGGGGEKEERKGGVKEERKRREGGEKEERRRREGEESVREGKREIGKEGREEDVTHVRKIPGPFPLLHCMQVTESWAGPESKPMSDTVGCLQAGQGLRARLWCAHV